MLNLLHLATVSLLADINFQHLGSAEQI